MDLRITPFTNSQNQAVQRNTYTPGEAHGAFKAALNDAMKEVNEMQHESQQKTVLLAKGEINDLHDVMITGQKASVMLQATVEVRNKVVEAYQEIMRMQV
ncbi:flagellar hook-basal body complex protein FliE [Bacillus sp. JCM 19034]|uniref:flagellar hook-basal body complex protein FliE n=1 Tax=Bacillus sp. JCM 19034 TaxID=1481928 RepID=UPI0007826D32|nr:flagellar hook-basal body complex protein FliE [Bacillus sp. JCM 19034]